MVHRFDFPGFGVLSGRGIARHLLLAACLGGASVGVAVAAPGAGESAGAAVGTVDFDIPAQSLADALVAYGAATGLEVYYDGAWAIGRRSVALKGRFTPESALGMLLHGSGYAARMVDPRTFTLTATAPAPAAAHVSDVVIRRYEPYFAALQARISQALCGADGAAGEIVFSVSVDRAGVISRTEMLHSSGDAARDARVFGLRGMSVGGAPPAGMPQPVTMAVYPPAPGDERGCPDTSRGP